MCQVSHVSCAQNFNAVTLRFFSSWSAHIGHHVFHVQHKQIYSSSGRPVLCLGQLLLLSGLDIHIILYVHTVPIKSCTITAAPSTTAVQQYCTAVFHGSFSFHHALLGLVGSHPNSRRLHCCVYLYLSTGRGVVWIRMHTLHNMLPPHAHKHRPGSGVVTAALSALLREGREEEEEESLQPRPPPPPLQPLFMAAEINPQAAAACARTAKANKVRAGAGTM